MLAGGTDDLTPLMLAGFAAMGQLKPGAVPFGEGCGVVVLERADHAVRRGASRRGTLTAISSIGMLAAGHEDEALDLLTAAAGECGLISLSGTAPDMPELVGRLSGRPILDPGRVIGRSLSMGGSALPLLVASLPSGGHGLHIAASPQGPYFAVQVTGGPSV
jgi:hypothetical protein